MKGRESMDEETQKVTGEEEQKITIEVPADRLLETCLEYIVGHGDAREYDYEDSGGARFTRELRKRIDVQVTERVESALGTIIDEEIRARVSPVIDEVCAEGFPIFSEYGEKKRVEPFAIFVRKALESMFSKDSNSYRTPVGQKLAGEAFKVHVGAALDAEMKWLREQVRKHVDQRLSGDVVAALRDGLGLKR